MRSRRKVPLRVVVADGSDPTGDGDLRPIVQIVAGQRTRIIDEAETALVERDLEIFQRGPDIVRVAPEEVKVVGGGTVLAQRIVKVGKEHMRERFSRAVNFKAWDKRADEWVTKDTPQDLAAAYLERVGLWQVPTLHSVSTIPVLRADGTIAERPGYDRRTGVFYDPCDVPFPAISGAPTRSAAVQSLDMLDQLLGTFDFVDEISRSVALSALLTPLFRGAIAAAPLHGITAPVAGSGKSKIVNLASILVRGHEAPVISLAKEEAETDKRITANLLAGDAVASIDNAERTVGGQFLCQVITEPVVAPRLFNTQVLARIPNTVSWYATGNNLRFEGDMVRRALLCRLDPHCERPELREFETPDPCLTALRERPVLVACALTIARAFAVAGCPTSRSPLGSFADWSRWVRDPLIWLGRADPVEAMNETRHDDPKLAAMAAVVTQWESVFGVRTVSSREVAEDANRDTHLGGFVHPDLREALLTVAEERGAVSSIRLGRWLSSIKGRQVNGKYFMTDGNTGGVARWWLA